MKIPTTKTEEAAIAAVAASEIITIKTDGAKIKAGMATIIAALSVQIDAVEAATVAPIKFRRRKAANALAQVAWTDAQIVAEFGSELTPAQIREQITAEFAPVQTASTAEIARYKNIFDRKRAKLVTLNAAISASPAAELIALVTQGGLVTPYSFRVGFKTWADAQLAAQVDSYVKQQELHVSAIDAISSIGLKLAELSDVDLATTVGTIEPPPIP